MPHQSDASAADIENRFAYHPATTQTRRDEHDTVRGACKRLAHELDRLLPAGREKALALTNLEQVMFWANSAVARRPIDA